MKIKSIILAAGKGTRMKSELPKVAHKVNGIPMIIHVLNVLDRSKLDENIMILGYKADEIEGFVGKRAKIVIQKEQLGTGHAVKQARESIGEGKIDILITCGDTPLLTSETITNFIEFHKQSSSRITLLTANFDNPTGYGRIIKDNNGNVTAIVEEKEGTDEQKKVKEINTGVYCIDSRLLFDALNDIDNKNEKGEYYLTDIIKIINKKGITIHSFLLSSNDEVLGVNSKVDLAQAEAVLRERKNKQLMNDGVTMIDPKTVYIEEKVEVEADVVIYPNVIIEGDTKIKKGAIIKSNSRIENSIIHERTEIDASVIEDSVVGEDAKIGPFAHLRPKSNIGKGCKVGNFVETKKSTLKDGVKAGHLTYLGDATIEEGTNIGAGTITCNYDGKNKFKTEIGKNVFVGSDTKFVAPVKIGDNALIGAGSVITENVPQDSLSLERGKQIIKKDWVKTRDNR